MRGRINRGAGGEQATPEQTGTAFRRESKRRRRTETHWKIEEAEKSKMTRATVKSLQEREGRHGETRSG